MQIIYSVSNLYPIHGCASIENTNSRVATLLLSYTSFLSIQLHDCQLLSIRSVVGVRMLFVNVSVPVCVCVSRPLCVCGWWTINNQQFNDYGPVRPVIGPGPTVTCTMRRRIA